ncbi:DUF7713 domain-containing protein [Geomobilimonas luticola]
MSRRLSNRGLVIDGKAIDYDTLINMLCSYEGSDISIQIIDSCDSK